MKLSGNAAKIVAAALALLLITVIWWLLVFSPKRDAINAAEAELDTALLRAETLQTRLAQLGEIKDNELSYLFAIGQMESSIPATPQADAFIEDITFLAETTGVELSAISLTPPVADPDTGGFEVPVSLNIEGEYFEVLGFLYGVEALDRLVRVDSIGLNPLPVLEVPVEEPPEGEDVTEDVAEPRVRPNADLLDVDITMRIFTRSPAAGSGDGAGGAVPQDGTAGGGDT
ncbi:type 4a pilus biogenesis protein PilO [Actinomycetota bacterium]